MLISDLHRTFIREKTGKRNFNYLFEQILYSHQRSGFPLLFDFHFEKSGKTLALSRPRRYKSLAPSKTL